MFIIVICHNCIKILAVSGCSLILSASVIAEEPYGIVSYHRSFVPRATVCAYIHVRVLQQRGQPQVV